MDWFDDWLVRSEIAANIGPDSKEFYLLEGENHYTDGKPLESIFYHTRALFHSFHERYPLSDASKFKLSRQYDEADLIKKFNEKETTLYKRNSFFSYITKYITSRAPDTPSGKENVRSASPPPPPNSVPNCLGDIEEPLEGVKQIAQICGQLPPEWTVLQLSKGWRTQTTFSTFQKNLEGDAPIYLTILRHARSAELPEPICLRFAGSLQADVFEKHGLICDRFKKCILINVDLYNSREMKQAYWKTLKELDVYIEQALADLRNFLHPWTFLFTGRPSLPNDDIQLAVQQQIYKQVDRLCDKHDFDNTKRVLLSLATLHRNALTAADVAKICQILVPDSESQQNDVKNLLMGLLSKRSGDAVDPPERKHYPCILVVDDRLDHIFWEELNVQQEFTRFDSLQRLWELYQWHHKRIRNGYLQVHITEGGCLVNPDDNLPKTEMRMKSLLETWTPHWRMKFGERPLNDEVFNEFLKKPCFVYAGHGSGLQYVDGKKLVYQQVDSVVFLFGCDSSRLRSSGMYSELIGTHLFYHHGRCPALIGTLLPGLDANMDIVAAEIITRWIAPKNPDVLQWQHVNTAKWRKTGEITENDCIVMPPPSIKSSTKNSKTPAMKLTMADCGPKYHVGSLCAIVASIHQRKVDARFYNTVGYVCRGLPVWNCEVESMPQ